MHRQQQSRYMILMQKLKWIIIMESYRKEIQSMITTTEIVNLIQTFQQELFLYSKKFTDHTEPVIIHLKEKKYSGRIMFSQSSYILLYSSPSVSGSYSLWLHGRFILLLPVRKMPSDKNLSWWLKSIFSDYIYISWLCPQFRPNPNIVSTSLIIIKKIVQNVQFNFIYIASFTMKTILAHLGTETHRVPQDMYQW